MNKGKSLILLTALFLFASLSVSSCKAKTCDGENNVADNGKQKRKVKNIGLFSKREMRRKKW